MKNITFQLWMLCRTTVVIIRDLEVADFIDNKGPG